MNVRNRKTTRSETGTEFLDSYLYGRNDHSWWLWIQRRKVRRGFLGRNPNGGQKPVRYPGTIQGFQRAEAGHQQAAMGSAGTGATTGIRLFGRRNHWLSAKEKTIMDRLKWPHIPVPNWAGVLIICFFFGWNLFVGYSVYQLREFAEHQLLTMQTRIM